MLSCPVTPQRGSLSTAVPNRLYHVRRCPGDVVEGFRSCRSELSLGLPVVVWPVCMPSPYAECRQGELVTQPCILPSSVVSVFIVVPLSAMVVSAIVVSPAPIPAASAYLISGLTVWAMVSPTWASTSTSSAVVRIPISAYLGFGGRGAVSALAALVALLLPPCALVSTPHLFVSIDHVIALARRSIGFLPVLSALLKLVHATPSAARRISPALVIGIVSPDIADSADTL